MSYQVIARKYRPQTFADVVGQEHVTQTLAHAIEQNRIAHAYLFCGPRGTGKTTIARIFAKALNCTGGPKADFDVNDPKCAEIAEGRSIDVLEIDGASNNGVEQVRELRETCKYAPASSKFKIYIIDEVHMLSTAAFNALLKTLEEPPAHVKFMFATTDPEKVLPTILSRCQRFDLRRIPSKLIVQQLSDIAKNEKVEISPEALFAIARGADGGMRDAESTLDQLISFCGNKIEESDVLSMFGLTAQNNLLELSLAILNGDVQTALRQLNDLAKNGKDLGRLLSDLLNHFRNLLIFQVSRGDLTMIEASESEAASLREQTKMADSAAFTRIMEVLTDAEVRLRDAVSKKILLEVALLKAIEARNAVSLDSVLKRLQELREGKGGEVTSIPLPASAPAPAAPKPIRVEPTASVSTPPVAANVSSRQSIAPAEIKDSQISAPKMESPVSSATPANLDLETLWARLLEAVGRASPFARSYLLEAHPVSFAKNVFIIGFDPEFADHIALVDNSKNHTLLQTKLGELGHPNAQFKFIQAEAPANRPAPVVENVSREVRGVTEKAKATQPSPPSRDASAPKEKTAPVPFNKDDFKNDPLIQKALEIFKGTIVEVRA
jgi:DNA polymerase-3 subunit gamma/tau